MAKKKKAAAAAGSSKKAPSKSQVYATVAEDTGLTKKQVAAVFDSLANQIKKSLKGPQQFTMPGLCKMVVKKRPAMKARMVRNPATGEMVMAKPKPASKTVRVRALKALKDMV
jgi:nucleoid DNA-binding protein